MSNTAAVLLDPLDVRLQLDDFRGMTDGWLDGAGLAPAPDFLDWLSSAFERLYRGDAAPPHLYPTEDGGVQAEWSLNHCEATPSHRFRTALTMGGAPLQRVANGNYLSSPIQGFRRSMNSTGRRTSIPASRMRSRNRWMVL